MTHGSHWLRPRQQPRSGPRWSTGETEGRGLFDHQVRKDIGASRKGRLELETVLQFLRADDELVVTRLDHLGRDTRDVLNLIHECEQRGASITILEPHVSTRGEMGHIVITVLGMVAQMERRFIKERQREGIDRAKAAGRYQGGKRRIDREAVGQRHLSGETVGMIAKGIGCSRMQIYCLLQLPPT